MIAALGLVGLRGRGKRVQDFAINFVTYRGTANTNHLEQLQADSSRG